MKRTALNEIETRMATGPQMKDVYATAIQAVPELTFEEATMFLRDKSTHIAKIRACFPKATTKNDVVASWELFYREIFSLTVDLSMLKLPPRREGFDRLIVVAEGLTPNQVYATCEKHFPCSSYYKDLDASVPKNDRVPMETYAIWVRDRVEADEELKNLSADDLVDKKTNGETLLERMLHELKYFLETGKHLDLENWTLCNGSRDSGGRVPDANWYGGFFRVSWDCRDHRSPRLRSREVVTL